MERSSSSSWRGPGAGTRDPWRGPRTTCQIWPIPAFPCPARSANVGGMGRRRRPNLPGAAFHITARAQNREPLFSGLERGVDRIIRSAAEDDGLHLLAYAVMSNHVHLLVVQDNRPLGTLLQPLFRRIALLVMRRRRHEGHVFERPYKDRACLDPDYARECITYIHLNPVRADICSTPAEYAWSSHRLYCDSRIMHPVGRLGLLTDRGLRLFAQSENAARAECVRDYQQFIAWRSATDAFVAAGGDLSSAAAPAPPSTAGGNAHWRREFETSAALYATAEPIRRTPPDLLHLARQVLADAEPPATLELLRSGGRTRPLVALRRQLIARALLAGYTPRQVARYLRVSSSAIKAVGRRQLALLPR